MPVLLSPFMPRGHSIILEGKMIMHPQTWDDVTPVLVEFANAQAEIEKLQKNQSWPRVRA